MKIKHKIHHHAKKIGQHIAKHHKKYILGSMGYLLSYLFFIKIFAFKIVIIKVILVILAILGIYNRRTTFAEIQPVCINNVNLIPLSPCKINFTNIKDAITYLENRINIANASIYDSTDYKTLHETLRNYCPENKTIETDKIIQDTIDDTLGLLSKEGIKKLSELTKLFDVYKKHSLQMQQSTGTMDDFCLQKYIDYVLIDTIKKTFMTALDKAKLSTTQNAVFESINRKNDTILGPLIDEQIIAAKSGDNMQTDLDITDQKTYANYYKEGSYSKKISEKIVQLSNIIIATSIQKLQNKKVLTPTDINTLKNKITVQYIPDCRKTQGSTTVEEIIGGTNNKRIAANVQNITLNVNICFNYQYVQNLKNYVEQITVHELGHYVYYIKDTTPQTFQKICRKTNKVSCSKTNFFSTYAQSGPEEDYAEAFLHRYLGDSTTKSIYSGNYYSGNYFSGYYILQTKPILSSKLNYFATLFK